jgi:hypothetical protein
MHVAPAHNAPTHVAQTHGVPAQVVQNSIVQPQAAPAAQMQSPTGQQISDTQIPIVQAPVSQVHQSGYPEDSVPITYTTPSNYASSSEITRPPEPAHKRPMTTTGLRLRQAIQRSHDTSSRAPSGIHSQSPAQSLAVSGAIDSATISARPLASTESTSTEQADDGVFRGGDEEFDL